MSYKVFIDGAHGTTGLKIREYLDKRSDIEILNISEESRKDLDERVKMASAADVTIMCLPDAASRELAEAVPENVKLIDTSTAHRTAAGWVYGMPELCGDQREKIAHSCRVANPGCHATGFILLVRPLIDAGIISADYPLSAFCVTGYSGGGKKMIQNHEKKGRDEFLGSPGQYALSQHHKHLPEMTAMTGISAPPAFSPVVGDFYSGMVVTVPLDKRYMKKKLSPDEIREAFKNRFAGEKMIHIMEDAPDDGFIHGDVLAGKNYVEIFVLGNEDHPILISRFDNLGKGASGAAVQNLNLMLGAEETTGLL